MQQESKYIIIDKFKGVDFSNEDAAINTARSPLAVNIISDVAGRPQLRTGIKPIEIKTAAGQTADIGKVIHIAKHGEYLLAATKTGLYAVKEVNGINTLTASAAASLEAVCSFKTGGKTYFAGSGIYKSFDGGKFSDVEGYAPTTTIGRKPEGGGTVFEAVNMLTGKRINSFLGDGRSAEYWLDGKIDLTKPVTVKVSGQETSAYTKENATRPGFTGEYGKITFTEAPADGGGIDNVLITFTAAGDFGADKIKNCRICSFFGLGNDSRVFLSGNPDFPNTDWYSGNYAPEYFPDTSYTEVGDDGAIMGYLKQYGEQIIIKEGDGGTIFLRSAIQEESLNITGEETEKKTVFTVKEGITGVGAAAMGATEHINGDPVYLTNDGVYGFESNSVTNQQVVQLRSFYINAKLKKENLKKAKLCKWGKYLIVAIEDKMYIADTEQTNYNPEKYTGYEWYYWELPVSVTAIAEADGRLLIGTAAGLYIFKDEAQEGMQAYSDEIGGQRKAISAMWTTPILYGGDFARYKTILKRGTCVLVKPFSRSSGEILMSTNKVLYKSAGEYTVDILDWDDIDFNRFTFEVRDEPRVKCYPKKHRKVLFFQMAIRHTAIDEGWGINAMRIAYRMGSVTKKGN